MQKLYIKNMVCNRCILVVRNILQGLGAEIAHVSLGEVVLSKELSDDTLKQLSSQLESVGFRIIDDRRMRIIEQIKNCVRDLVHQKDGELRLKLSEYLVQNIHLDYTYLTSVFSESEGTTIEKYLISQKIERVKELLTYDDLSLNEIADKLHYSSAAHLSSQFKKVTGLTPSYFKRFAGIRRIGLDEV